MDHRLRAAVIGLGPRGRGLLNTMVQVKEMQITAICDLQETYLHSGEKILNEKGVSPTCFTDYHEIIDRREIDLAFVATSWITHIPIAIDFLNAGIPVAIEVAGAASVEECWELVRAQEKSGTPFMFLENCCFGRRELAVMRMAQEGVLGRIEYCEGAYCHDIRHYLLDYSHLYPDRRCRLAANTYRHGDLYPTHSIGAISKILNINCGNRLLSITSLGSPANGLREYIARTEPENPLGKRDFACEDMTVSLIKCAGGEVITLKHSVLLPRPYSRGFLVQGTRGIYSEDKDAYHLEAEQAPEEWHPMNDEAFARFDHPLWQNYQVNGSEGHGGMDYLTLRDFVLRVRDHKPMAIDVYDAAVWMSLTALSAQSIELGGTAQPIPDFTGGKWAERTPVEFGA